MGKRRKKKLKKPNWAEVKINPAYAGGYYATIDYCGKVWKKYGSTSTEAVRKLRRLLDIINEVSK